VWGSGSWSYSEDGGRAATLARAHVLVVPGAAGWNQDTSMVCLPGYLWCGGATPVCVI